MSVDNLAVVREAYAAIELRDFPALLALLAPGIELHDPDLPGGGTFSGHDGVMRYLNEALGGFEQHRLDVEELVEVDRKRVVAAIHQTVRARGSDADIELRDAHVWTLADGRVARIETFLDLAAALRAVGLDPADS